MTHTVTHTGKRADGNNGTNRLRPHPFWTKNCRKTLCSRGWKALRQLVRMRSAVRICPAAPRKAPEILRFQELFFLSGFKFCRQFVSKMLGRGSTCTAAHTEVGTVKRSARKQADGCVPQRIGALLCFPGGLTTSARELARLL